MKINQFVCMVLSAVIAWGTALTAPAHAGAAAPTRTMMLYCVGSTLESSGELATKNLIQAMESDYNENINMIVMTGGAKLWHTSSAYLSGAEHIDPACNQIWKLEGTRENEDHGKMRLLEAQESDGAGKKPMSEPAVLTSFMDYCYANYPADRYDLILWDHGGGPVYGFGYDYRGGDMSLSETAKALSESRLIQDGKRLELIDYDACLMGSAEIVAALSEHTDCFICSPEEIPGGGQDYKILLDTVKANPSMSGFELGKVVTDDFVSQYKDSEAYGRYAVMAAVNAPLFKERMLPLLGELSGTLLREATVKGDNGRYSFYDEIYSSGAVYAYGSERYSLVDLGGLLSTLSCRQIEDEALPYDANQYTDAARALLELIADGDIIYLGKPDTLSTPVRGRNLRGSDGSISATRGTEGTTVYPTGLSVFFPSKNIKATCDYVQAMREIMEALPDSSARRFLSQYAAAAACYSLIDAFGKTVYALADSGAADITYDDVKNDLRQKGVWNPYLPTIISYLAEYVFGDANKTEAYLAEIVAQQAGEVITSEHVIVKNQKLIISDGSDHAVTDVCSAVKVFGEPSDPEFKTLLSLHGYNYSGRNRYFPDGFALTLEQTSYSHSDSGWAIKSPPESFFAIYDSEGAPHIADIHYINGSHTAGYIPIVVLKELAKEKNYYLYVSQKDGEWKIDGISGTISAAYIPMDSEEFTDENGEIAFTTVSPMTDAVYGKTTLLPISAFSTLDNTKENWGLTVRELDLKDLPEPYTYSEQYSLTDIYDNVTDITEIVKQAEHFRILGDADGDGEVTLLDATVIQRILNVMPVADFHEMAADVDGNGIDITDATMIQRYLADIAVPYPIGEAVEITTESMQKRTDSLMD